MRKLFGLGLVLVLAGCGQSPESATQPAVEPTTQEPAAQQAPELISSSPEGAAVYFIGLEDGAEVTSPVTLRFGLKGMGVAPAGVQKDNTGHHHLLINHTDDINVSIPLPASDTLIHYGGGQTETTIELAPGEHTLRLVLGNYLHIPHDPPVWSETVTITVSEP